MTAFEQHVCRLRVVVGQMRSAACGHEETVELLLQSGHSRIRDRPGAAYLEKRLRVADRKFRVRGTDRG